MSTLLNKANEILAEKNSKIIPTNIVKGITIFDITGTAEAFNGIYQSFHDSSSYYNGRLMDIFLWSNNREWSIDTTICKAYISEEEPDMNDYILEFKLLYRGDQSKTGSDLLQVSFDIYDNNNTKIMTAVNYDVNYNYDISGYQYFRIDVQGAGGFSRRGFEEGYTIRNLIVENPNEIPNDEFE